MAFRARSTDRRQEPRFDVIGPLPGSVMTLQRLAVHNLSCGGALVHSQTPLRANTMHTIQFDSAERRIVVQARVVRTSWSEGGVSIALEFTDLDAATLEQIQQLFSPEADLD